MRRWLLIALLFVLPLQIVWGAAAPYCAHESQPAAAEHFGHHEHDHRSADATAGTDDPAPGFGVNHVDCSSCHLGASATLPCADVEVSAAAPGQVPGRVPGHRYCSPTPPGPERPDIAFTSPAARFGGGVVRGVSTRTFRRA